MSAQEATLPHSLWTSSRRSSMILNVLALKVRLRGASCSLGPLADPSSNTEASHPWYDSELIVPSSTGISGGSVLLDLMEVEESLYIYIYI